MMLSVCDLIVISDTQSGMPILPNVFGTLLFMLSICIMTYWYIVKIALLYVQFTSKSWVIMVTTVILTVGLWECSSTLMYDLTFDVMCAVVIMFLNLLSCCVSGADTAWRPCLFLRTTVTYWHPCARSMISSNYHVLRCNALHTSMISGTVSFLLLCHFRALCWCGGTYMSFLDWRLSLASAILCYKEFGFSQNRVLFRYLTPSPRLLFLKTILSHRRCCQPSASVRSVDEDFIYDSWLLLLPMGRPIAILQAVVKSSVVGNLL